MGDLTRVRIVVLLFVVQCFITKTLSTNIKVENDAEYQSSLPSVPGAVSCGGVGTLDGFYLEGCIAGAPCSYHLEKDTTSELLFTPSQNLTGIGLRLAVKSNGSKFPIYSEKVDKSQVQGHVKAVLRVTTTKVTVPFLMKVLLGSTLNMQFSVFRNDAKETVETCVEAKIKVN